MNKINFYPVQLLGCSSRHAVSLSWLRIKKEVRLFWHTSSSSNSNTYTYPELFAYELLTFADVDAAFLSAGGTSAREIVDRCAGIVDGDGCHAGGSDQV